MNDSRPEATGEPGASSDAGSERELELFAIEEQFAGACRSGARPRLTTYLRRYPQYADELIAFASAFLPESALHPEDTGSAHEKPEAPALSPGTRRALDAIFASMNTLTQADGLLLVAEQRTAYTTAQQAQQAQSVGLAALAHAQGISLDELAHTLGLSADELAELARVAAQTPDELSQSMVHRLAKALGVSDEEAIQSLAHGI